MKVTGSFACSLILALLIPVNLSAWQEAEKSEKKSSAETKNTDNAQAELTDDNRAKLIVSAARRLVEVQEEDGAWPYEGVYRVRMEGKRGAQVPVGYRIGGSAIVCTALLHAQVSDREDIDKAITKSTELILKELEHPLMKPAKVPRYDVRVWGHIYALDYFSRLAMSDHLPELQKQTKPWITKLVDALVLEELDGGGWNYASRGRHACFVTAPAIQALLMARMQGAEVPDEVLQRGADILAASRSESGSFQYSGKLSSRRADTLPGSIARAAVSEATMMMLGRGDKEHLQMSIDAFHEHWDELEKRRKKTGTHKPPHGVAPYYFYYGHRYLAQAIRMLPAAQRDAEFKKFATVLMRTKDPDDTWNDRVFDRSKAYGTAMSMLALSREDVPLPKPVQLKPVDPAEQNPE